MDEASKSGGFDSTQDMSRKQKYEEYAEIENKTSHERLKNIREAERATTNLEGLIEGSKTNPLSPQTG